MVAGLALAIALLGEGCWCAGDEPTGGTSSGAPESQQTDAPTRRAPETPAQPAARPSTSQPTPTSPPAPTRQRSAAADSLLMQVEDAASRDDREAMDLFRRALDDSDPDVREAAVDALEWAGTEEADEMLSHVVLEERDEDVRIRAIEAVEETAGRDGIEAVGSALGEGDASLDVKETAIDVLESIGDERAAQALAKGLNDPDPDIREEVVDALDYVEDPVVIPDLWEAYRAEADPDVRDLILDALETLGEDVDSYRE